MVPVSSIFEIITRSPPHIAGIAVGYCAGAPHGALLLLTVPIGMMMCGAAAGVAKALSAGLERRTLSLFEGRSAARTVLLKKSNPEATRRKGPGRNRGA
jgi:hypothetical protein